MDTTKTKTAARCDAMTHEELLAEIDANSVPFRACIKSLNKALRAAVELHKPKAHLSDNDLWCEGCYPTMATYPCPTIQAIERALG